MKAMPAILAPILRSELQGRILARLYLDERQEWTPSELARVVGSSLPTVLREVDRLAAAGYLNERKLGRSRVMSPDPGHPLHEAIRRIVLYGYGPKAAIESAFGGVKGVEKIVIHGSWAARYLGIEGREPEDVDVVVVGTPDPGAIHRAAEDATRRTGRPINAAVISPDRWTAADDGFIATVRSRPMLEWTPEAAS